ncbi:MAG TPA: zinc-binding dehydrogenase [Acidimicrobiales bacterium]|jgi:2-desacetyl-2-hydroxyethyl bacteriochlorophyllide A dehydrogenase|nr:zinc-binding dehydrogenase [Acidimicrobiales bacterium]
MRPETADRGDAATEATGVAFTAPRHVELRRVPVPEPADGQVLVRTLWSGISSGTEMLAYRGEIDPDLPLDEAIGALGGTFTFPFRYGYACVGRVERSRAVLSEGQLVFAYHPHQDLFVVDVDDVVPVDGVEPRLATLLPLVETALQVALDAGRVLEEPVLVTGLGAVGLTTSLLLQRAGARVTGVEPAAARRAVAASVGVPAVAPEAVGDVLAGTGPHGVPLVVEASGRPEALRSALGLLAHEGEVLVVSWYGTKEVPLPLGGDFHRRRLVVRSTQVSTVPAALSGRWTQARRRAVARRLLDELPLAPLATHDFPFAEAPRAYAAVDAGASDLVHAALWYT